MRPLSPLRSFPSGLAAFLLAACTGSGDDTTISPLPPGSGAANVSGTIVASGAPVPRVTVQVFDAEGIRLTAFDTLSTHSGRWSILGLEAGTYRFVFEPPAPDPGDPSTELRRVVIGAVEIADGSNLLPPVFFAPVSGGLLVSDNLSTDQVLRVLTDPFDGGSPIAAGFEEFEFFVQPGTRLRFDGKTLTSLGIDDDPGTSGTQLLVEVALLRPDQLSVPLVDADGCGRSIQAAYALFPMGVQFTDSGGAIRPLEIDLPNVNGLAPFAFVEPQTLDPVDSTWKLAGASLIDPTGAVVEQFAFTGLARLGIIAAAGPPPPVTDVVGTVMSGGSPLARAGMSVVTSSGFSALTDATGAYRIEDVPVPLNAVQIQCTAFTDAGLAFAAASASAIPSYPETTIDLDIEARPTFVPSCVIVDSEPAQGALNVQTNPAIRLRFDGEMDPVSLQSALTVIALPDGGALTAVSGTIAARNLPAPGGGLLTDVFFVPDASLPTDASVSVVVTASAVDVDGNALSAACTLSFRTGTSTLVQPQIFLMFPESGPVGSNVTVLGTNLDLATVLFDGSTAGLVALEPQLLVFQVPLSEGTEAPGPRTVELVPGGSASSFFVLPHIDAVQVDVDPDPLIETLADRASGNPGTSIAGVDQNDGTLLVISGQNLVDPMGGATIVTFGQGDANAATLDDGDAEIDGVDEAATANRIDVRVPPRATTGGLTVTVDLGAQTATSAPFDFTVVLPPDLVPAAVEVASLNPAPGAAGVATTETIRVTFDSVVSKTSRLVVGSGMPLRTLLGTTLVTTTPDGTQGVLEFLPAAGTLPVSSTIFVQVASSTVKDLAGYGVTPFDFTFTTGASSLAPPSPPSIAKARDPVALGVGASPEAEARVLVETAAWLVGLGTRESDRDELSAGAAARTERLRSEKLVEGDEPEGDGFPSRPSWGDAGALAVVQRISAGAVSTFLRVDFADGAPAPAHQFHRFRLRDLEAEDSLVAALVADLDANGRYELYVFAERSPELEVIAADELVRIDGHSLIVRLPDVPHTGLSRPFELVFETYDLLTAHHVRMPGVVVSLDLP